MKSGGPWNLRGLRPEARAAARDAARRSGMSVGEWLNNVIPPTEAEDDETWWSADGEERSADRSVRKSREEFRERLGAGAKISRTNRAARVRETTIACSNRIAIGCRRIATTSPTSANGALGAARASRARIITIAGIGFATAKSMNRGRNSFRLVTSRMNGIAIAANPRLNGNPATKQNAKHRGAGNLGPGRRSAIATATLTIPIG